ncbi:autotransporter outer membrane beta-barrel domain-containing protein [Hyphomicrobium sp.]|uniref:autotransporter family protein n=1 Tax=Hyphomicrobium sp. TaxID=82 RepID=UPI002B5DA454|nr:autotransporter outer membrane beta-barrel domain-containing protein [Hyphomicrobium sp.]HRN87820.1 autotransporter outer membrane beta-barrel domain-containing protein [Hyphomicrobium sp.]HRQ26649.1 autotransporter outer membrane beta-barrel domain-containing protein [Hyphomicrobium sp.]
MVADGITRDVSGPFSTIANSAHVFHALNGGIIQNIPGFSVQVTSSGIGSHALVAGTNGQILLGAGTIITTTNSGSRAIDAGLNSTIAITGATISTSGASSTGITTSAGASVTLTNSSLSTTSSDAISMGGGSVILDNTSVQPALLGAALIGTSNLTLRNGSSITTTQAGSIGVSVSAANSAVTVNDSEIHVQGANTAAVEFSATGTFDADGATVTSDDGAAFSVTGGTLSATITDSAIAGGSTLLSVGAAGATANIFAANSTLTGAVTMAAGATAQVNLQGASTWNITGDSILTLLINQAGSTAQFTPPGSGAGPFKTLTVTDYLGLGGTVGINTHLGGDGSPSDRLVIDGGNGLGTSSLAITNVGGTGAVTQLNGILVVDAINGGSTVPGLFTLAAPVTVGPYEYSLYRGSVDASNPNAWYLRSILDCSLDPSAPVCSSPATPGSSSPGTPDYRQETSLYAAAPAMTLLYGRLMLDTLHDRRGTGVSSDADGAQNAAWARVIGQHGGRDGDRSGIYGSGPKYDYDFWAFQGGLDLYRDGDAGASRNHAGAFFAIGHGSGDVDHFGIGKAGENSFMAYSWGAYWTHHTPQNAYIDALLLGTWYDIDASSNRMPKMTTDGGAFGASLAGGFPVYTGSSGFSIEPQAQLAFQTINLDHGSDTSSQVHFDNVNSLVGRIGVRFAQDFGTPMWLTAAPSTFTAWVQPNFWYEFLGDPKTKFSAGTGFVPFAADMGGTTFEINTGFTADVADGTAIYASASYLVGIGEHADGNAFDGKLGVKVAW